MKKSIIAAYSAATAVILPFVGSAFGGVLTLDPNNPVFSPDTAFTNNTITADTDTTGLISLSGSATVTPDSTNLAQVIITGSFAATAGDTFSAAYSFIADLNIDTPVTYMVHGTATIGGLPVEFSDSGTLSTGLHRYEGTAQAPAAFPFDETGTFSAELTLVFNTTEAPLAAAPGTVDLTLQQVDVQLLPDVATVTAASVSQNISTRANVGSGDSVLIGGIIITGSDTKQVALRAVGPSSGVTGALSDPTIELYDSSSVLIDTNDNWMDLSTDDQTVLTDNGLDPGDPAESALVENLAPGLYTAIVRGVSDTTGVALVEAYDLDNGTTDSKFGNISTRGFVDVGDNVMIGGFILGGGSASQVIVRGLGPSLADVGVTNVLADPSLEVVNADGDTIASNDNWMDDPNMDSVDTNGLAPTDPNESAIYNILPAGLYTVILSGVGDTTGNGLVETYNLD